MTRNDVPKQFLKLYDRAMIGKSRRAAITCFCTECMGWNRKAVKDCTAPSCPLYPYRPGAQTKTSKARPNPHAKGGFGRAESIGTAGAV